MPVQMDIFGVIVHYIYHGSEKDNFIYCFFGCLAPLIDVLFGRASFRRDVLRTRDNNQANLNYVCLLQILLYTANLAAPILAKSVAQNETVPGFASVSAAAFMPLFCVLFRETTFSKPKLVYALAVLVLTLFSLPLTGMADFWTWIVMLQGNFFYCLFYHQQRKHGEFRVEVALGSAFIFSIVYFLRGNPAGFSGKDIANLCAFIIFTWMYEQATSRYSMHIVDSDPFFMCMARLEKISILLFVAFLGSSESLKWQGSVMACFFVTLLCFSASVRKKTE